jgi:signal transduction histidine kinase/ligand-binding sensor domain-containing protein/DNA-binding response OmpR family regulator
MNHCSLARILLSYLIIACWPQAFGQSLSFKHITVENGLSQNSVRTICQDSLGYIWVGTQNGLNRYNGYDIEIFEAKKNDTLSLSSNFIYTLCPSTNGKLWIGTNHGVCLYDQRSAQFQKMDKFFEDLDFNRQFIVFAILVDSDGSVWVLGEGKGIHLFKKENSGTQFEEMLFLNEPISNKSLDIRGELMEDNEGNIWIGTCKTGLWKFDKRKNVFDNVTINGKEYPVSSIIQDQQQTIWIGTFSNGVFQYHPPADEFVAVNGLNDESIRTMYIDHNGKLWIGTDKGGLNLYDAVSKTFRYFDHNITDPNSLLHNSVISIFRDRQNILWIGTYAGGVNYSDPATGAFQSYHAGTDPEKDLSNNIVTGFAEDAEGNIWIGTDRGGLNYLDRKNKKFSHLRYDKAKNSISTDIVKHLLCTSADRMWVATWLGGLNLFDPKTRRFYTYLSDGGSKTISSNTINFLFEDSKENLWLGTPAGLDLIDGKDLGDANPPQLSIKQFKNNPGYPSTLSDNYINVIFEDRDHDIWVGTKDGLNLMTGARDMFYNYHHNPGGKKIFTNDYVQCMAQLKNGDFLIGTYENGLLHYNPAKNSLRQFNKSNGFPSNSIIGVIEAANGDVWVSTTNGLVKFNSGSGSFILYTKDDGLQANEFKENAYYRLQSGEILFGGTNGFNLFHPDSVAINPAAPTPIITKFKIFNNLVTPGKNSPLTQDISITKEITLNHDQSFIGFDFTTLNLTVPQKNSYAYMLGGIDKEWNYVGNQRAANYSYVPPGTYVLYLKAANNDGVWSKENAELVIVINPPWWNSAWFKTLAAMAVVFSLWAVFRLRTRHLYERKKILEKTVKVRTRELQHTNELLSERQEEILAQKEEIKSQRDNLEQQYNTIQSLSEIGQKITASIKKEELIKQMYALINTVMDASLFSIGYYNAEKQMIEFSTLKGYGATIEENLIEIHEHRLSVWCLKNKQTLLLDDIQDYVDRSFSDMSARYRKESDYQSAIYLPIDSKNHEANEILIVKSHSRNSYTQVHLNTLKNLTAYIAIAFDNARVYKEIEAQSEILISQSAQLEELDRMKTRFFINISHEFRTPLTLIVGPLQKMLHQNGVDDWATMHRQLVIMNKNANQLLRLINELLEIRTIESGAPLRISASERDIVSFTSGIIARFEEMAHQHGLGFSIASDRPQIPLWFDMNMMEKVLLNLFSNACKYTPRGGKIDISLGIEEKDERRCVKIVIKDSGVGIPESEIPYLFTRFYQGRDPVNDCQESTGIGLSFAKDLINLHSGSIEVKSQLNKGTSFIIHLPLHTTGFHLDGDQENNPSAFEAGDFQDNGNVSVERLESFSIEKPSDTLPIVLLVEDNMDVLDFLKMEFEKEFLIIQAANGREGLHLALQHVPDLIISDVMMPVMDGIEFCGLVKSDERTNHIPLILLTAKSGEESHLRGLGIGADDYVAKPFNPRILKARVQNLITSRKKLHAIFSLKERIEVSSLIENDHDRMFVEKVDKAIKENMKNTELNHELLAREIGMSKTQLYRKLHSISGKTVHEYIRNYRMKCANEILTTKPDFRIFEIAYEVGFKDHAYFSKCFHAFFGVSAQARKRANAELPSADPRKP